MSTFAQLAAKPGVGIAYLVDVSVDKFASASYHWGTGSIVYDVGMSYASLTYDQRILSVGNVSRAFGSSRSMTAGTVALTLDNADGALDFLCDRSTFGSTTARAQFRVWMLLYDPANVADAKASLLGVFECLEMPTRDTATIRLSLSDSAVGAASELKRAPNPADWAALNSLGEPLDVASKGSSGFNPAVSWLAPFPVVMGDGAHAFRRLVDGAFLLCAVKGSYIGAPSWVTTRVTIGGATFATYKVAPLRSLDITVAGETWHVAYCTLGFDIVERVGVVTGARSWLKAWHRDVHDRLYASAYIDSGGTTYSGLDWAALDVLDFAMDARPWSAVLTNALTSWHPADVAKELLYSYSGLATAQVETASFDVVKACSPQMRASGSLDAAFSESTGADGSRLIDISGGVLGPALSDLAGLGRFDLAISPAGVAYASSLFADPFASLTTTPTPIDEALMGDVQERIDSRGGRWEPFTECWVTVRGVRYGPFASSARLTTLGRHTARAASSSWLGDELEVLDRSGAPTAGRSMLDYANAFAAAILADPIAVRPILRFRTSLDAVTLELGDFITASWTRGGRGTPYVSARWRVESWTLQSENGCVDIEAVWCADIDDVTRRPYLLDNEALLVRVAYSAGRTLTLTTGSTTIACALGNFISDGVSAGDVLVVADATEATADFGRNRALRVVSITDATHLVVHASDFGAGGPFSITSWTVYRGATTYHTAVSDPTNYPSGGTMYGKTSDSTDAGKYSDNSAANLLLNG